MKNSERKAVEWHDGALRALRVEEAAETGGFLRRLGGVLLFAGLTIGLTLVLWAVVVAAMLALGG